MKLISRPTGYPLVVPAARWVATGIALLVLAAVIGGIWWKQFSNIFFGIALGLAIVCVIFLIVERFLFLRSELENLQNQMVEFDRIAADANRRLDFVLHLSRKFVEADEEDEVIEQLIKTVVSSTGALGATIVPLDKFGQPMSVFRHGDYPVSVTDEWLEYLASSEVRRRCVTCQNIGHQVHSCSLIEESMRLAVDTSTPGSIYCFPIRRGETEFGVLNLYLSRDAVFGSEFQELLQLIIAETSLVLESIRLRRNERSTVQKLQMMERKNDLNGFLEEILESIRDTIRTDFVYLYLDGLDARKDSTCIQVGRTNVLDTTGLDKLIHSMMTTGQPVLIGDLGDTSGDRNRLRSVVAAPVSQDKNPAVGVLLAGNHRPQSFKAQHLGMMQSFSNQIGMAIRNSEQLSEIEVRTIIAERTRLAREIHDGLAQTLGFLKLQTAQMQQLLSEGQNDRLAETLSVSYKVLSEAYLDTRQAIDDLRTSPNEDGLMEWLRQAAIEFESICGIPVTIQLDCEAFEMKPEVQAQLIRIIQETLSNIRKHASADHVWIVCQVINSRFVIEIRDDGCGFSSEDTPGSARYGLRGIRERADLIGAELDIITEPQKGTIARITLRETLVDAHR